MVDQITQTDQFGSRLDPNSPKGRLDQAASTARSLSEQAMSVGKDLTDKAKDLAENSSDALKDRASDFVDAAKGVASQASDKLMSVVDEQKSSGADYVSRLADTMRRAAREFDADLPIAGTYIRKAASQVESVSDTIRSGSLDDLISNAQSFARRQPTAFLGIAVLAGFGAVRFLKSSSEAAMGGQASAPRSPTSNTGYGNDRAR